jgi:hypothetical protein
MARGPEVGLTIAAQTPRPYVHLDNRALVIHDGRQSVAFGNATYKWLAETVEVLIQEQRATRQQGSRIFGGFIRADGTATLFAGTMDGLVTCDVAFNDLRTLYGGLTGR